MYWDESVMIELCVPLQPIVLLDVYEACQAPTSSLDHGQGDVLAGSTNGTRME